MEGERGGKGGRGGGGGADVADDSVPLLYLVCHFSLRCGVPLFYAVQVWYVTFLCGPPLISSHIQKWRVSLIVRYILS